MICLSLRNVSQLILPLALFISMAANATLVECNQQQEAKLLASVACAPDAPQLSDDSLADSLPISAPDTKTAAAIGFRFNDEPRSAVMPDSLPLIGLICAVLGVLLLRAKSHNSK